MQHQVSYYNMLDIRHCLKISYRGKLAFVICEAGFSFNSIMDQACEQFHIPESHRAGVVLTNGQGYVFEKQLLEYFLLLFPSPELLFYLRLDWHRLRRALIEPVKRPRPSDDEIPEILPAANEEIEYVAEPVHRQNCFIGILPGGATVARLPNISPGEIAANALANSQPKKRMRVQLYAKIRKSVVGAVIRPMASALAPPPRSIRI